MLYRAVVTQEPTPAFRYGSAFSLEGGIDARLGRISRAAASNYREERQAQKKWAGGREVRGGHLHRRRTGPWIVSPSPDMRMIHVHGRRSRTRAKDFFCNNKQLVMSEIRPGSPCRFGSLATVIVAFGSSVIVPVAFPDVAKKSDVTVLVSRRTQRPPDRTRCDKQPPRILAISSRNILQKNDLQPNLADASTC